MPSLYVHIPFCEKKCLYCDFYSIESLSQVEQFLASLHREIDLYASYGNGVTFETVFFGGGTPSLLQPAQLESILTHLRTAFEVESDAEITVETNPGTVTREKLCAFRSIGINRLSIGIQSFHEDELRFLSRIHDREDALRCVENARDAGFANLNIDLIFSLPGQSLERWESNLVQAIALDPEHVSAYSLIVEDNTPLARMVSSKQVSPNPIEIEAGMYEFTMEFLAAHRFEHYEVSNYAKAGFRSRHNYNYWNHHNYLSFGPSAHSFWREPGAQFGVRWWNMANISHYCDRLLQGKLPFVTQECVRTRELMSERVFLGLRSDGLDLKKFEDEFGVALTSSHGTTIRQLVDEQFAQIEHNHIRLTNKGFLLCDEISARLLP